LSSSHLINVLIGHIHFREVVKSDATVKCWANIQILCSKMNVLLRVYEIVIVVVLCAMRCRTSLKSAKCSLPVRMRPLLCGPIAKAWDQRIYYLLLYPFIEPFKKSVQCPTSERVKYLANFDIRLKSKSNLTYVIQSETRFYSLIRSLIKAMRIWVSAIDLGQYYICSNCILTLLANSLWPKLLRY